MGSFTCHDDEMEEYGNGDKVEEKIYIKGVGGSGGREGNMDRENDTRRPK